MHRQVHYINILENSLIFLILQLKCNKIKGISSIVLSKYTRLEFNYSHYPTLSICIFLYKLRDLLKNRKNLV